ncbi:hypothetical protein B0O99DRAFT_694384 [Bisporella sp. PMI_857]|nr:hypothetical protein B0O99DRAFT_694384 [Bisporella sp. PMI_857]
MFEWTTNDRTRWVEFIRTGVDGMITDHPDQLYREVQNESLFTPIRMATREDNPFHQPNSQYTLICKTGDVRMGGTDSHVTFTINGSGGTVSRQINTFLNELLMGLGLGLSIFVFQTLWVAFVLSQRIWSTLREGEG